MALLHNCIRTLEESISQYKVRRDVRMLWSTAMSEISKTLNQFGRVAGELVSFSGDDYRRTVIDEVNAIAPAWGDLVEQLLDELNLLRPKQKWNSETFAALEKLVEQFFHATGIYPRLDVSGLHIEVN
jgi:phage-related minor tail protein